MGVQLLAIDSTSSGKRRTPRCRTDTRERSSTGAARSMGRFRRETARTRSLCPGAAAGVLPRRIIPGVSSTLHVTEDHSTRPRPALEPTPRFSQKSDGADGSPRLPRPTSSDLEARRTSPRVPSGDGGAHTPVPRPSEFRRRSASAIFNEARPGVAPGCAFDARRSPSQLACGSGALLPDFRSRACSRPMRARFRFLSRLPLRGLASHSWRSRTFHTARFDMLARATSTASRNLQGNKPKPRHGLHPDAPAP